MAKWQRSQTEVPPQLGEFDPLDWGNDGDDAVDKWKHAALRYLKTHPSRCMPFGEYGDALAVIREAVRLKGGYERAALGASEA